MAIKTEDIIFEKTIAEIETEERLPDVDQINEILSINNPIEMDNRIFKNSFSISKILKTFHKKLCENFEMTSDEIEVLLHCFKFVDTLNLFMNNQSIASILKLISKINEIVLMVSNLDQKDIILKQIKYTEMTIIYYKKRFFKNLFFGNGTTLAKEIEKNLEMVTKKGMFDQRLFKQMQNLFYVVQGKIEEKTRGEIQEVLNEMKKTSIKYKKQRFGYYEDYNDYSEYKNYSNVAGYLYDYNENFYDNDYSEGYGDKDGDYKYNTSNLYGRNSGYGYPNEKEEEKEKEKEDTNTNTNTNKPPPSQSIPQTSTPIEVSQPTQHPQSDIEVINIKTLQNKSHTKDGKNIQNYYNENFFKNYLYIYDKPTYPHQHTHYHQHPSNNQNSEQNQKEITQQENNNNNNNNNNNSNLNTNNATYIDAKSHSNYIIQGNSGLKEMSNNNTPIKNSKLLNMKKKKGRGVLLQEVTAEYFHNVNSNEKENGNDMNKKIESSVEDKNSTSEKQCEVQVPLEEKSAEKKESEGKEEIVKRNTKVEELNPQLISSSNAYNTSYKSSSHPYFKNAYNTGGIGAGSGNYYPSYNYYNYKASYPFSGSYNINQKQKSHSYSSGKYITNKNTQNGGQCYYRHEFVELEDKKANGTISDFNQTTNNKAERATSEYEISEGSGVNVPGKATTPTDDIAIKKEFVNMDLDKMFEPETDKPRAQSDMDIITNEQQLKDRNSSIPNVKSDEYLNLKNPVEEILNDNVEVDEECDQNGENANEIHPQEENTEDELCEGEEESDSEDNEEIEREFKNFITESLGENQKELQEENYYIDVEGKSKNNKVIFENDSDGEKVNCEMNMNNLENSPQLIESNNNISGLSSIPPPIQKEENEGDAIETEKSAENKTEGVSVNIEHPILNLESLKESTKSYMESIKTIDPKILMAIKSKLTEDHKGIPVNNNNTTNNINNPTTTANSIATGNVNGNNITSSNMNYMYQMNPNFMIANSNLGINPLQASLMNYYQRQFLSNQIPIQQYIFSNYANFFYRGRDANIHREYFALKCLENENPSLVSRNLENFEKRILIPIYQRINFNVNKKRGIYFYTFSKYKKLIHRVLGKEKILKKVKPYGSYMNNFLIDSGDIDICIVPKCGILEFSKYLEKVSEEIATQNYAEHKLSHHNSRYLLLKVMDIQTKFVIDITVHNMLPILNTNLIRLYSLYDQRFHILGLYIKHWAKINKIHGAADNYLSSYALLLMLIHFLQKVAEPRVLPNLQKIETKEVMYEYLLNGETMKSNIYYEEDAAKIKAYMKKINNGLENKESATYLLLRFFEYYSYYFDSDQKISIHMDINESKKKVSDLIAFSIDDPFDMQHNPGKSMIMNSVQYNKFITAMKKEINFIMNGEYVKRIEKINTNQ